MKIISKEGKLYLARSGTGRGSRISKDREWFIPKHRPKGEAYRKSTEGFVFLGDLRVPLKLVGRRIRFRVERFNYRTRKWE